MFQQRVALQKYCQKAVHVSSPTLATHLWLLPGRFHARLRHTVRVVVCSANTATRVVLLYYLSINIELYHVTILTLISIMYNRCCTPPHMKGSARTYSWLIATSTARKYHSINSTRTTVELQYDRALQYECVKQNTKGRRRKGRHGRLPQDGAIFR